MAEAFLNHLCPDKFKGESAGMSPTGINPYVNRPMAEVGIDLSAARAKSILEFQGRTFDYVVTVCDQAREACPFFPGDKQIHRNFPDPSSFTGTDEEILAQVRLVRDEIKRWINDAFCEGNPDSEVATSLSKHAGLTEIGFFRKLKWRPGRDSDPGPAGDSRIY